MSKKIYTALDALCEDTGTKKSEWVYIDGPDSHVGVDFWFRNKETRQEANVNLDQTEYSISIEGNDQ